MNAARRRSPLTAVAAVAAVAAAILTTAPALASAAAGEFPDDWFFGDRPEGLVALEGRPAPGLDIDTWIGDAVTLEQWRGEVVIVDFWATWCGPCMAAIPKNVDLVNRYEDEGLRFIGVHDSRSGWDRADQVVRDTGINYVVGRDDGGLSVASYALGFWPTYVAIDRRGTVRAAGLRPDRIEDVVRVLLAEPRPAGTGGGGAGARPEEFPAEWFVGGLRPERFRALEGEAAPAIEAADWLGGTEAERATAGRVTVIHFLAPWSRRSRAAVPELVRQAADLRRQGVVVLAVASHDASVAAAAAMLLDAKADGGEDAGGGAGDGATGADADPEADPDELAARLPFPVARDEAPAEDARLPLGRTAAAYGLRMWPLTVVVDRAGRVRAAGLRPEHVPAVTGRLMAERLPAAGTPGDG